MRDFWLNPDIDLTEIKDSMELDSGEILAILKVDNWEASAEVRGEVRVFWNGEIYTTPSDFPRDLKKLIHDCNEWYLDDRLYISENNWFEIFINDTDHPNEPGHAEVVDLEGNSAAEIFNTLYDMITWYKETETGKL